MANKRKGAMITIMGDFNDPCLNFEASHDLSQVKYELYNLSMAHGLTLLIKEPTTDLNLLDLMFTNSPESFANVKVLDPIHDLDHYPIFAEVKFKTNPKLRNKYSRRVWHYDNGNYDNLALELKNTPWHILLGNCGGDIDEMFEVFTKILNDISSENIPNYVVKINPNDNKGMTGKIKKLFKTCHRLQKRFKKCKNLQKTKLFT